MTTFFEYLTVVLDPILPRNSMHDVVDRIAAINGVLLVDVAGLNNLRSPINPNKDTHNDTL